MTKIRIPFVFAAALVLLVLVVIARAPSVPSASARPVQLATPTFVTSRVTGVPAIKASLPGHIPAFTEGDVRSYVHAHPFAQGIDDSKITSIRFIPSSQATALMKGERTGIGDNEMVCYV